MPQYTANRQSYRLQLCAKPGINFIIITPSTTEPQGLQDCMQVCLLQVSWHMMYTQCSIHVRHRCIVTSAWGTGGLCPPPQYWGHRPLVQLKPVGSVQYQELYTEKKILLSLPQSKPCSYTYVCGHVPRGSGEPNPPW